MELLKTPSKVRRPPFSKEKLRFNLGKLRKTAKIDQNRLNFLETLTNFIFSNFNKLLIKLTSQDSLRKLISSTNFINLFSPLLIWESENMELLKTPSKVRRPPFS